MHEGRDVPTDEDEDESFARKRPLGDASHGSLRDFPSTCGADEPNIELFASPDLHGYRLAGTDEGHWFMAGVYHRICMLEVKLLLSNESIDHLTEDLEVTGMRAIMLM